LPFECRYCGGKFCVDHRLPESHSCEGVKSGFTDDYWNVPVRVKKEPVVRTPVKTRREKKEPKIIPKRIHGGYAPSMKGLAAYGYNNIVLALCTVLFFIGIVFPSSFYFLALFPNRFIEMPWQIITSMFFHVDFGHYLVNMIVLLFFGGELERRVGGKNYLKIFLLAGLAGNVGYLTFAFMTGSPAGALGASGAIYGIMGTLAIIAPEIRVLFFFFIPISIRVAILIFAAYNLIMLPMSTVAGVAYAAHLAGLLVGLYYGDKLKSLKRRWPW